MLGLFYYLISAAVLDAFMDHWGMGDNWRKSRFNRVIHYKTERPFAYRVLTPWVINAVSDAVPDGVTADLEGRVELPRSKYGWRQGNDTEYVVGYLLLLGSLLGTLLLWRGLLVTLRFSAAWSDLTPPLLMLCYPMVFMKGGFIYDFPELFFSSAALLFFLRRNWWLYYFTFVLAVLNKESSILIAVWFLASFAAERRLGHLAKHLSLSAALGMPLIFAVRSHFASFPGSSFQLNIQHNLEYFSSYRSFFSGFDAYAAGIPVPQGLHLFNIFFLVILLFLSWRCAPRIVWLVFCFTCVAILPLYLVFGWEDELRVFAPAFPALFLLVSFTLRHAYDSRGNRLAITRKEERSGSEEGAPSRWNTGSTV